MPANFQRDGFMAFHNQGNRPNYQSTIQKLTYPEAPYDFSAHEQFVGSLITELSSVTELDFEQPRKLWEKVFDDGAKQRFVDNVAGHLGGAKSDEIKRRTVSILYAYTCLLCLSMKLTLRLYSYAIHPDIGNGLAQRLNLGKVEPFKPLPASEAIKFRANLANRS